MQIIEPKPGGYYCLSKTKGVFDVSRRGDVLWIQYEGDFTFYIQDESFKGLQQITDKEVFSILVKAGIPWNYWTKLFDGLYQSGFKDGQDCLKAQFKQVMGL